MIFLSLEGYAYSLFLLLVAFTTHLWAKARDWRKAALSFQGLIGNNQSRAFALTERHRRDEPPRWQQAERSACKLHYSIRRDESG
jgi:hypothetical protein